MVDFDAETKSLDLHGQQVVVLGGSNVRIDPHQRVFLHSLLIYSIHRALVKAWRVSTPPKALRSSS